MVVAGSSWREKHYQRVGPLRTTDATPTVIDTVLMAVGDGVTVKNCQFVAREVGGAAWALSDVARCAVNREGANGNVGIAVINTGYYGSGTSLNPAAGTIVATAGGFNFVVTGRGFNGGPTDIDWYLEYELFWQQSDYPE
jgi:hypothetical protein